MSRDDLRPADHDRARDLAATRVDDALSSADEAWLADHLGACEACAAVAADYDAQHDLFGPMRAYAPEPPRDLWARTSAAIEAEHRRRSGAGQWRRRLAPPTRRRLSLAPLAAVLAVAVIVGAGLLNSRLIGPGAGPTPIAMAAADVQFIARDPSGNLQIHSGALNKVCPVDASDCGLSPTFAVTAVSGLGSGSTLLGAISPTGGQMVVVARDGDGEGVYVVPMRETTTPPPSASPIASTAAVGTAAGTPPPTAPAGTSAAPAGSAGATSSATPRASTALSASASASSTASASSSAGASSSAAASPSPATSTPGAASGSPAPATAAAATSGAPSASLAATPSAASAPFDSASPSATSEATALPSIEVTPAPEAAVKIASGVRVVGAPAYSPNGDRLAFAAMPSDGSTGPDIYVWAVGDKFARSITSDHGSWLAAWTGDGILASRVADGLPSTVQLDPATGHASPIGPSNAWLPAVSAEGDTAAWWAGTVKLGADGTWVPDSGKLVLGGWPDSSGAGAAEVIAKSPIDAWQVRWDDKGTAVAVWVGSQGSGRDGKLSLYRVDGATGAPDMANPMLDATAATPDFSLRSGRLVWTEPSTPEVLQVLAWSGKTVGRLQVPADGSGTVVP